MHNQHRLGTMAAMLAAVLLTGCGSDAVLDAATDEELDTVGEYAAITLLKYDAQARSRLVTLPEESGIPEESEPAAEPAETLPEESAAQETTAPEVTDAAIVDATEGAAYDGIEDFLGFPEGVTAAYAGYDVSESYADASIDYLSIDASEGKTLVAVRFVLANTSDQEQSIDLLDAEVSFRVTLNDDYTRTALTTMLTNDFANFSGTLAVGETREVVVLIEANPAETENITSLSLYLKNASDTYTIQLI